MHKPFPFWTFLHCRYSLSPHFFRQDGSSGDDDNSDDGSDDDDSDNGGVDTGLSVVVRRMPACA